jgi:YD repeat-containing protein
MKVPSILSRQSRLGESMKTILAIMFAATSVFAQQINPPSDGPTYDSQGRMISYSYADGTHESYAYDGHWRMTRFTDRAGGVMTFQYMSDGSMLTIMPDGTIRH